MANHTCLDHEKLIVYQKSITFSAWSHDRVLAMPKKLDVAHVAAIRFSALLDRILATRQVEGERQGKKLISAVVSMLISLRRSLLE